MRDKLAAITQEVVGSCQRVEVDSVLRFLDAFSKDSFLFVTGKGRSGLIASTFSNRLVHLGFKSCVIGDIATPHTKAGDIVLIVSGSGETQSLISIAQKAKAAQLKVLLVTTNAKSTLALLADEYVLIQGSTKYAPSTTASIQPMGSLFEQSTLLLFDAMVLELMERFMENASNMALRHADLE